MSEYEFLYGKWIKGNNKPLQDLGEDDLHNLFVMSLEALEMLNVNELDKLLICLWSAAIDKNYTVANSYDRIICYMVDLYGSNS